MTVEGRQGGAVAGGRDDRVDAHMVAVGEVRAGDVERGDRGDDPDAPGPEQAQDCAVDHGRAVPGLVVLHDDGTVESPSDDALRWLAELPDDGIELPSVVYEVARSARRLADDTARPGPPAPRPGPAGVPAAHATRARDHRDAAARPAHPRDRHRI